MLYQIGPLAMDTYPFNADELTRDAAADHAAKPVIGTLPRREFMGEGDDKMQISGKLLPLKIGGLTELEMAHAYRKSGEHLPVMRGDGRMLGWFAIERVSERHGNLFMDGRPMTASYTISLVRTQPGGEGIVGQMIALFGAL